MFGCHAYGECADVARRVLARTDEEPLPSTSALLGASLLHLGRYAEAEDILRGSIGPLQVSQLSPLLSSLLGSSSLRMARTLSTNLGD